MNNRNPQQQPFPFVPPQAGMAPPPPPGWGNTGLPPAPKKRMSTGKKVGIGAAAFLGVAFVASLGNSDEPSTGGDSVPAISAEVDAPAPNPSEGSNTSAVFGAALAVRQGDAVATVTITAPVIASDQTWATNGDTVHAVTVTFDCQAGVFKVNPFYFEGRTTSGRSVSMALGSELQATDCKAGEMITGTVNLAVSTGDDVEMVILKGVLFQRLADWHTPQ